MVGGVSTVVYGADYVTTDVDVLLLAEPGNLRRLGEAMTELGARLRVGGLSDAESRALPVPLRDGSIFRSAQITNWRTDAGDVDVMTAMPDRDGGRHPFEHYLERAVVMEAEGERVLLASLADVIDSKEFADREKDRVALPRLRLLLAAQERGEASKG